MAVVAGVEGDDAVSLFTGQVGHEVEQHTAVALSARFWERHQIVDVKVFSLKKKLKVAKTDGRHSFAVFFNECELVAFAYHILYH